MTALSWALFIVAWCAVGGLVAFGIWIDRQGGRYRGDACEGDTRDG